MSLPISLTSSLGLAVGGLGPSVKFRVPATTGTGSYAGLSCSFQERKYNKTTYPLGVRRPIKIVVKDSAGVKYGEVIDFSLSKLRPNPINEIPEAEITIAANNPTIGLLIAPTREVEIWRGAEKIPMDFVVVKAEGDENFVTFTLKGLPWYFTRRNFGRADRTNMLLNGDFELGTTYWTHLTTRFFLDYKGHDNGNVVDTTSRFLQGSRSLSYTQPDVVDENEFMFQDVIVRSGPLGKKVTFSAWAYVPSSTFVKPNYRSSGLLLARMPYSSPTIPMTPGYVNLSDVDKDAYVYYYTSGAFGSNTYRNLYTSLKQYFTSRIDRNHAFDNWQRHIIEIDIPPNTTEVLHCRFEGPIGTMFWDAASLTADESFENESADGDDQSRLVQRMVMHAQGYRDDGSGGFTFDASLSKSDLGITPVVAPTGIKRYRQYRYTDHAPIFDAINEFPTLYDGLDWSMTCTGTTRYFNTHFPRKGSPNPIIFEIGSPGLVTSFRYTIDGEATANVIIVLGLGNDSGREEGFAADASALGGLTLEAVYNATPGSSITTLDAQALRGLNRFKNPVRIVEMTLIDPTGHLYNKIVEGNVHRVRANRGWLQIDEQYRILSKELNVDTDEIKLVLNPKDF